MVKYRLVYFDVRGLAEPIRVLLNFAGQEFEDVRLDFETFKSYKPKTKYGHVPVLEFDDGRKLYEGQAILIYLARQFGLAGKDDFEQAQIIEYSSFQREISEEIKHFFRSFATNIYTYEDHEREVFKKKAIEVLTEKLPIYEKILAEAGSGYLAKSGITWMDFFLAEAITTLTNVLPEVIQKFSKLVEYHDRIYSHPKLEKYFKTRNTSLL